jgi:hypothetical protein
MLTQARLESFRDENIISYENTQHLIEEVQELQIKLTEALASNPRKVYLVYTGGEDQWADDIVVCDSRNVAYLVADAPQYFPEVESPSLWSVVDDETACRRFEQPGSRLVRFQYIETRMIMTNRDVIQLELPNAGQ